MNYLNDFVKKFCFVKLISDYQNKNEEIINSFNELSLKNILSIIDMDELVKILPENNILINDIINNLPKLFNSSEIFYKLLSPNLNFKKIVNSIIENMNKFNNDINYEINKELLIQFSPIKFNFIHLDYEVFDFIEKLLGVECNICQIIPKRSFYCLICGEKICQNDADYHIRNCSNNYTLFIDTNYEHLLS